MLETESVREEHKARGGYQSLLSRNMETVSHNFTFQMNKTGCAAIPISGNFETDIKRVDLANQDWFITEVNNKLAEDPVDREYTKKASIEKPEAIAKREKLNADIRTGHQIYHRTTDYEKQLILNKFDQTTTPHSQGNQLFLGQTFQDKNFPRL